MKGAGQDHQIRWAIGKGLFSTWRLYSDYFGEECDKLDYLYPLPKLSEAQEREMLEPEGPDHYWEERPER